MITNLVFFVCLLLRQPSNYTNDATLSEEDFTPSVNSMALIPKPVIQGFHEGVFRLDNISEISILGNDKESNELASYLSDRIGARLNSFPAHSANMKRIIFKKVDTGLPNEGYLLSIYPDSITIEASQRSGLFYGMQTLLQLFPPEIHERPLNPGQTVVIPCQIIEDYPFLSYRGTMLDIARTFSDKQTVLHFVDRMAHHKLNYFHWHLADDEGWRIEIKSHPELAEIGGYRGGDSPVPSIYGEWGKKYGGYFTQEEIKEVIEYAAFRNITIIPEIDLPGHSRTVAKITPSILCGVNDDTPTPSSDRRNVWCASKESNYELLDDIFKEIAELFPSEYIHIGGDEVFASQWNGCASCKKLMQQKGYTKTKQLTDHFVARVSDILKKYNKKASVWDEASESGTMNKANLVYGWQGAPEALAAAKKGYKTIVMPGTFLYIDQNPSPDEDGINWGGIIDTKKVYSFSFSSLGFDTVTMKNIVGVEGAFWSELLVSHTPDYLDYQVYPRLCAIAEIGWTSEKSRDWDDFYKRLTSEHLLRLEAMGIKYRQFPPTVYFANDTIKAIAPFFEADIRYTTDGTTPTLESPLYTAPIADSIPWNYRFSAFLGRTGSYGVQPRGRETVTLGPLESKTITIDLSKIITENGLWYLRELGSDRDIRVSKISVTSDGKTSNIRGYEHTIGLFHIMRFKATDSNKRGVLTVTATNKNKYPCDFGIEIWKAPYIEPAFTFTSSQKENPKYPYKHITDYDFSTYARTASPPKKGDHFTFTFTKPVDAQSIEVWTGLSYLPRYLVPVGKVQVSIDGKTFTEVAELSYGKATITTESPVKAIRIISESEGSADNAVAIQDLRIVPRKGNQ